MFETLHARPNITFRAIPNDNKGFTDRKQAASLSWLEERRRCCHPKTPIGINLALELYDL
jgi:hypothetical protein